METLFKCEQKLNYNEKANYLEATLETNFFRVRLTKKKYDYEVLAKK